MSQLIFGFTLVEIVCVFHGSGKFAIFAEKVGLMANDGNYIRFDWAMKHMLRDKANFGIPEEPTSVLMNEGIKIEEILERARKKGYDEDCANSYAIGYIQGYAEGYAEGRAEGKAELLKRMISAGMSVSEIANLTGYSTTEIEALLH